MDKREINKHLAPSIDLVMEMEDLEAQRDELLAALEAFYNEYAGSLCRPELLDMAEAALKKAGK